MRILWVAVLIGMAPTLLMEEQRRETSVEKTISEGRSISHGRDARATIRIPETVFVASERFRLGEIATLESEDTEIKQRLAQIELGASPVPGYKRAFTRSQLLTRLRQHGFQPDQFRIEMGETIQIERRAQPLQAETLEQFAREQLRLHTGADFSEWKLENPPAPFALPEGSLEYSVEGTPRMSNTSAQIEVVARVEGQVRARYLLRFRAPAQARTPLVRTGETVRVCVKVEGLVVEVIGQARASGGEGEFIQVYIPDTQKTLRARVVEKGIVEVSL